MRPKPAIIRFTKRENRMRTADDVPSDYNIAFLSGKDEMLVSPEYRCLSIIPKRFVSRKHLRR